MGPTPALGIHPALAVREVAVTVTLELGPALLTQLLVCNTGQGLEGRGPGGPLGVSGAASPVVCQLPPLAPPSRSVPEGRAHRDEARVGSQEGPALEPQSLWVCSQHLSLMSAPQAILLSDPCSAGWKLGGVEVKGGSRELWGTCEGTSSRHCWGHEMALWVAERSRNKSGLALQKTRALHLWI